MDNDVSPLDTGQVGERVVCQWLRSQGFRILSERWHCRLGELDIVALEPRADGDTLAFVEVKARRARNWDQGGLMAITPVKQRKLIMTAQLYLSAYPNFETWPCRFDVALVQVVSGTEKRETEAITSPWVEFGRDRLRLKEYIRGAFEASS